MISQPGKYRARAVDAMLCLTSTGKEQIAVSFELLDYAGEFLTWFGSFSEGKAFDITIKALRTCGWGGDDLAVLSGITENEVELVVEEEMYEDKRQLKVRWVNAPGSGFAIKAPLAGDAAKAFAARMRGAIRAIEVGGGASARPPSPQQRPPARRAGPPEPPPHTDSDLPPY